MPFQYSGGGYSGQPSGGGNPFYVTPGNNMLPGLQGIGKAMGVMGAQQAEKKTKAKAEAAYTDIRTRMESAQSMSPGDKANEYAKLHSEYPAYTKWTENLVNVYTDAAGKQPHVEFGRVALRDAFQDPDNAEAHLDAGIQRIQEAGGDATNLISERAGYDKNRALALQNAGPTFSLMAPKHYAAVMAERPAPDKWTPMTGEGLGVSFNPRTNQYRVNPQVIAHLDRKAEAGEKFSNTELMTADKIFETITKPIYAAHDAAAALGELAGNATPSAQVAAVIQFIKALDPTSTVTQNEANQIVNNAGLVEGGIAGNWNKLVGEGKITPKMMRDMHQTAQRLANSRRNEAEKRVNKKLELYGPQLNDDQIGKIGSLPDPFVIGGGTDADNVIDLSELPE